MTETITTILNGLHRRVEEYTALQETATTEWGKNYNQGKVDAYKDAIWVVKLWAQNAGIEFHELKTTTND